MSEKRSERGNPFRDGREVINWKYYAERLDDVTLMERAVVVPCSDDTSDAAVPVGGKRRGGSCCVHPVFSAHAIVGMLSRPEEFPDLRWDIEYDAIAWGEDSMDGMDKHNLYGAAFDRWSGEMFGYSAEVIDAFVQRKQEGGYYDEGPGDGDDEGTSSDGA